MFAANQAQGSKAVGGAIAIRPGSERAFVSHLTVVGNTVVANASREGSGPVGGGAVLFFDAYNDDTAELFVDGSVFWMNEVESGELVYPVSEEQIVKYM